MSRTIKVERTPMSDEWKRTIATNLAIGRARRHTYDFSLRTRWQIVRHRRRYRWADWRDDLVYLVRG